MNNLRALNGPDNRQYFMSHFNGKELIKSIYIISKSHFLGEDKNRKREVTLLHILTFRTLNITLLKI